MVNLKKGCCRYAQDLDISMIPWQGSTKPISKPEPTNFGEIIMKVIELGCELGLVDSGPIFKAKFKNCTMTGSGYGVTLRDCRFVSDYGGGGYYVKNLRAIT